MAADRKATVVLSAADPCVGWDPNGDCCLVAAEPNCIGVFCVVVPCHGCWTLVCPKPGGGGTFIGCIPGGIHRCR